MLREFKESTPCAIRIIVGLTCALVLFEIPRTPLIGDVYTSLRSPGVFFCEVVAFVVLALLYRFAKGFSLRRNQIAVVVIEAVSCFAFFYLTQPDAYEDGVFFCICAAFRIASSFALVVWAETLYELGPRRIALSFGLVSFCGGVLLFVLSLIPSAVSNALLAASAVVSAGMLLTSSCEESVAGRFFGEQIPALSVSNPRELAIAAAILFLPLVARAPHVTTGIIWTTAASASSVAYALLMMGGWVLGALFIVFIAKSFWGRGALVFYVLVLALLNLVGVYAGQTADALWVVELVCTSSSHQIMMAYIFISPFLVGKDAPFSVMPTCYGAMLAARTVFLWLGGVLPDDAYATLSLVVIMICLVGAVIALFTSGYLGQNSDAIAVDDAGAVSTEAADKTRVDLLQEACGALAAEYDLTRREEEILLYLANRYNAAYIAEKLTLSNATVKTHMRNIYAKLGVHSQTELLQLVESDLEER